MNFEDANVIIPPVSGQPGLSARTSALRSLFLPFEPMDLFPAVVCCWGTDRPGIHPLLMTTLEAHVKNQTVIASYRFLQGVGVFQKTHIKTIINSL